MVVLLWFLCTNGSLVSLSLERNVCVNCLFTPAGGLGFGRHIVLKPPSYFATRDCTLIRLVMCVRGSWPSSSKFGLESNRSAAFTASAYGTRPYRICEVVLPTIAASSVS